MGVRRTSARVVRKVAGDAGLQRIKRVDSRLRSAAIRALDVEARAASRKPSAPKPKRPAPDPAARRLQRIETLGQRDLSASVNQEGLKWASPDPYHPHPRPPASRHQVLAELHRILAPRTYFEIGIRSGKSLALSRALHRRRPGLPHQGALELRSPDLRRNQ